jgi:hypothetical protein
MADFCTKEKLSLIVFTMQLNAMMPFKEFNILHDGDKLPETKFIHVGSLHPNGV